CRVFRSDSVRREGHRITVDPESRATWRRRTATSPAARQPERTDRSARSSSTTKPPGADARNSDTVVTVRKAACRSGVKEAEAKPERVAHENRTRISRKERLPESDPETQDAEASEDRPFVRGGHGPTFNGRQVGEERDRDQEEKRHRAPSRKGFSVDEAQDQNG